MSEITADTLCKTDRQTDRQTVNLLFTGGWDSTFRLLQLSEYPIIVQPIYIVEYFRASAKHEQRTMRKIIDAVRKRDSCHAVINNQIIYDGEWVLKNCADDEISSAFQYVAKTYQLGAQYHYFALLGKHFNMKMECGLESGGEGLRSKATNAIHGGCELVPLEMDFLPGRFVVLPKGESQFEYLVFKDLIFSVIGLTKIQEGEIAEQKGWSEIMKMTWFCSHPIFGKPCGICAPCTDAMSEGMEWRMPKISQWRYRNYNKLYPIAKRLYLLKNRVVKGR